MFTNKNNGDLKSSWKAKAKNRRLENKSLIKRIKELLQSRNLWKKKARKAEEKASKLEEELKKIKKKYF